MPIEEMYYNCGVSRWTFKPPHARRDAYACAKEKRETRKYPIVSVETEKRGNITYYVVISINVRKDLS